MSPIPRERAGEEIVVNWRMVTVGAALLTVAFLAAVGIIISSMGGASRDDASASVGARHGLSRKFSNMPVPPAAVRETAEQATRSIPAPEVKPPKQESASSAPVAKKPDPVITKPVPVAAVPQSPLNDEPTDDKPLPFKRFRDSTEAQLTESLARLACELDLESERGTAKALLAQSREDKPHIDQQPILKLLEQRADLRGLPVRKGKSYVTTPKEARMLGSHSRHLHSLLYCLEEAREASEQAKKRASHLSYQSAEVQALHALRDSHLRKPDAVGALVQVLQVEGVECRRILIELLDTIKGKPANEALAQRAIFDCSAEVRQEALRALRSRSADDVRPWLLAGLRHPWPPAADHAAEAIVHLRDRGAIHHLIELLDSPSPTAIYQRDNQWEVQELVRINHLRNCLMCHALSLDPKDSVRGRIPVPGEPIPSRDEYRRKDGDFVRADVVYLRQDFSVMHQVGNPGRWPAMQRFDYLVRRRVLTEEEIKHKVEEMTIDGDYPQRQAVLFALRELTGHEATSAAGWRHWVSKQRQTTQSRDQKR